MERTITHGEMLGVVKTKTVYNKQNNSTSENDVTNKLCFFITCMSLEDAI